MIKQIVYYVGNPANAGRLRRMLYITLVLVVLADFLVQREHAEFLWDRIPGWSAFYGFISCALIIIVSKFLGHHGLMKREDYYD